METRKFTLRQWRKIAELSQKRLAKDIGVSVGTIINWEQGKTEPKLSHIAQLEAVLNIDWDRDVFVE